MPVSSSTAARGKASDTQHVVTGHGICNLRAMSSAQRARALIGLADPAFRDELTAAARGMHLI
jgi:itaconate CoA-transferase